MDRILQSKLDGINVVQNVIGLNLAIVNVGHSAQKAIVFPFPEQNDRHLWPSLVLRTWSVKTPSVRRGTDVRLLTGKMRSLINKSAD